MHCASGIDEDGAYVCCWGFVDGEFKMIYFKETWDEMKLRGSASSTKVIEGECV